MALRGNLRDFSLPDVFQLVTFSKKTGVLRILREDKAEGTVWFRDGDVFFASSNWHAEPLGERLVKAQRVTPQALAKALEIRSAEGVSGRRLGQILIDEGYITDKVLETFVGDQIQDTIFDLMRWDDGEFDFEAMPEAVEEDIGLSVSIENVVMEGARRLEEWNRIKKKIPSTDVVFKMATAPGEGSFEISLKPVEWNLLQLTDGTRSVAELAQETGRTDFEAARILYGLFSAGLLEFASDAEVEQLRAERAQRESVTAVAKAERKAADEAASQAALDREDALTRAAEERVAKQAEAAETPERPIEEPEFLGGASVAPTADDLSVFEQMMGAVLEVPGVTEVPVPSEAAAEPKLEAAPVVEKAPEPELPFVAQPAAGESSLELDLAGLLETQVPEAATAPPAEPVAELPAEATEYVEPAAELGAPEIGLPAMELPPKGEGGQADLAALLSYDNLQSMQFGEEQVAEALPAQEPVRDFERDLTALGLGEVPPELLPVPSLEDLQPIPLLADLQPIPTVDTGAAGAVVEPAAFAEVPPLPTLEIELGAALPASEEQPTEEAVAPQVEAESQPVIDLDALAATLGIEQPLEITAAEQPVAEEPIAAPAVSEPDFADLMQSLDEMEIEPVVVAEQVGEVEPVAGFDADLLAELAAEPVSVEVAEQTTGVISTDAFMEDISGDMLGVGLGDELSALTGAERPKSARPTASVNKIPEAGTGVIHRDDRVDRDTVMKIIDGIKNL